MFLNIINAIGEIEQDRTNVEEALSKAWDALPDSLFKSLIKSIVVEEVGKHTVCRNGSKSSRSRVAGASQHKKELPCT